MIPMSFSIRDPKRIFITLVAVLFMGVGLSVLNLVDLGTDPFTFMNVSVSSAIGWTLGNWLLFINVILFIPVILWGREQIGIGTVFNMVLVGYTVDLCAFVWDRIGYAALMENVFVRIASMIAALVLFIFSAATYMSTGLGTAPYDAQALILSRFMKKVPFKLIRSILDLIMLTVGAIVSGKLGIVTVLMMLFLGTTVEFVHKKWFSK